MAECTFAIQTAPDDASRQQRLVDRSWMLSQLRRAYGSQGQVETTWAWFQNDARQVLREASLTKQLSPDDLIALHYARSQPGLTAAGGLRPSAVSQSRLDAVLDAFQARVERPRGKAQSDVTSAVVPAHPCIPALTPEPAGPAADVEPALEAAIDEPAPSPPGPIDAQWTDFMARLAPPGAQRPQGSVAALELHGTSNLEDVQTLQQLPLADTALVRLDLPTSGGAERPADAILLAHLGVEGNARGSPYARLMAPFLAKHEGNHAQLITTFLRAAMAVDRTFWDTFKDLNITRAGDRWKHAVETRQKVPVGKLAQIARDCVFQAIKVRHLEKYDDGATRSLFVEVHTPRAQYNAWRHSAHFVAEAAAATMRRADDPNPQDVRFVLRDRDGRSTLRTAEITGKHELVAMQGDLVLASVHLKSLLEDALSCDDFMAQYPLDAPLAQNGLPSQSLV